MKYSKKIIYITTLLSLIAIFGFVNFAYGDAAPDYCEMFPNCAKIYNVDSEIDLEGTNLDAVIVINKYATVICDDRRSGEGVYSVFHSGWHVTRADRVFALDKKYIDQYGGLDPASSSGFKNESLLFNIRGRDTTSDSCYLSVIVLNSPKNPEEFNKNKIDIKVVAQLPGYEYGNNQKPGNIVPFPSGSPIEVSLNKPSFSSDEASFLYSGAARTLISYQPLGFRCISKEKCELILYAHSQSLFVGHGDVSVNEGLPDDIKDKYSHTYIEFPKPKVSGIYQMLSEAKSHLVSETSINLWSRFWKWVLRFF